MTLVKIISFFKKGFWKMGHIRKMRNDQIFTPNDIVVKMLDMIGYSGTGIVGKTIFEPSFGDGAFLVEIVKRILDFYKDSDYESVSDALSLVYGVEIDSAFYDTAVSRLNGILGEYGFPPHRWDHLLNRDMLSYESDRNYDYIIGNPPYIRIHDLDQNTRACLKELSFSSGMMDIYVAFYELCINLMSNKGKLCFITPNSFIRNSSQKKFRDYLAEKNIVRSICDYGGIHVFENADTYTAITLMDNSWQSETVEYTLMEDTHKEKYTTSICLKEYIGSKFWCFNSNEDMQFLKEVGSRPYRLCDVCDIQYGVSTNADKIYIIPRKVAETLDGDIVKPAIKASTLDDSQFIIFPYRIGNGGVYEVIPEEEMQDEYKKTYDYLLNFKERLLNRDMDKGFTAWYQYARSQGIQKMNNMKFVPKRYMPENETVCRFAECSSDAVVHSGMYIVPKNPAHARFVRNILADGQFYRYLLLTGKNVAGRYKTINASALKEYGIAHIPE